MKKSLIFALFCSLFITAVPSNAEEFDPFAMLNSPDVQAMMKDAYVSVLPFYQNIATCKPVKTDSGDMIYQIYGKNGSYCHASIGSYDCNIPDTVTPEYSSKMTAEYKQKIAELNQGKFSMSSSSPAAKYEGDIWQKYCKIVPIKRSY